MSDEYPIKDPEISIREAKAYAKKNYGSMKAMYSAMRLCDENALTACALYERAMDAKEAMKDFPGATYGDRPLATLLAED